MSLVDEKRRLRRADEFILMAKERIERQGEIIADLARHGQETAEAVKLLETPHMTLDAMKGYRTLVAEHVDRLRGACSDHRTGFTT